MSSPKQSKYARKRSRGQQMYGPGCCAHSLPNSWSAREREEINERHKQNRIEAARARARQNRDQYGY